MAAGLLALAGPAIATTFDLSGSGVLDTGEMALGASEGGGELMREIGGLSVALESLIPSATPTSDVRQAQGRKEVFRTHARNLEQESGLTLAQPALSLGSRRRNTAPPPSAFSAVSSPP